MNIQSYQLQEGIAATLRLPEGLSQPPVIILCHGFCGIQDILLPSFAEAFVKAGFAAVTFDYRGFGASEGERGRLIPSMQIDDIITVIDWVKTLSEVDAARTGLWGTSLGGGHVFGAAVQRPAIGCIVSQLGFADGEEIVTGKMTAEEKAGFVATLEKMADKREKTGKEMFVAITKVLGDDESKAFFDANKSLFPAMDIKIPFLTVRETLNYKPAESAARVICPVMVVVAGNDSVNAPEQGKALYEATGSTTKTLLVEEGANHYEMYEGLHFDHIVLRQISWFKEHLI
jgi:fermentation-respiration switch protein FrsA (DUF1100 family)